MSIHASNLEHGEYVAHCCAKCEAKAIVRAAKQGNKAQRPRESGLPPGTGIPPKRPKKWWSKLGG